VNIGVRENEKGQDPVSRETGEYWKILTGAWCLREDPWETEEA